MGCTTSRRAIVIKSASKNQQHGRETPNQPRENIFLGTDSIVSEGGPAAADNSCGTALPEDGMKRSQSIKEENKCQYIGVIKPVSKIETERQTSSSILEELQMQGLIKPSRAISKNRTADDATLVHTERTLQKPPAKLEKLEIKQKKSHDLPIEDSENKTREEQLKKELLADRSSPIISPDSKMWTGSFIIKKTSDSFQLPPLNVGTGNWTEKEELHDNINNGFEGFTLESDRTYNTIHEVF